MKGCIKKVEKDKIILITGAVGFIGFHLSIKLLEQGITIVGYDNMNDYYEVELKNNRLEILNQYENFIMIKGNLEDKVRLQQVFQQYRPHFVVNLAAQAGVRYSINNPETYIDSNIIGFFNILELCRHFEVEHLIYASSSSVYGANHKIPFSTFDKTDTPISLYAATKKSNELMAYSYSHLFGIPATGLRFFTVYGPYGRPDMAYYSFTKAILKGIPLQIYNEGNMYRDFTYIDDIVEGLERIINNPPKEDENGVKYKLYNIGNQTPVKLMYFIETLEEYVGKRAIKEYLPMQPGDVYQTYADINDLIEDFEFKPNTSIKDGLYRFVEWYKSYYKS